MLRPRPPPQTTITLQLAEWGGLLFSSAPLRPPSLRSLALNCGTTANRTRFLFCRLSQWKRLIQEKSGASNSFPLVPNASRATQPCIDPFTNRPHSSAWFLGIRPGPEYPKADPTAPGFSQLLDVATLCSFASADDVRPFPTNRPSTRFLMPWTTSERNRYAVILAFTNGLKRAFARRVPAHSPLRPLPMPWNASHIICSCTQSEFSKCRLHNNVV